VSHGVCGHRAADFPNVGGIRIIFGVKPLLDGGVERGTVGPGNCSANGRWRSSHHRAKSGWLSSGRRLRKIIIFTMALDGASKYKRSIYVCVTLEPVNSALWPPKTEGVGR
jgi:hypothetical protein